MADTHISGRVLMLQFIFQRLIFLVGFLLQRLIFLVGGSIGRTVCVVDRPLRVRDRQHDGGGLGSCRKQKGNHFEKK
jgi:hypothetical protein